MREILLSAFIVLFVGVSLVHSASANDIIRIAGSSTVFPYAKLVADKFHEVYPRFKSPVVESGGSGAGIKEFCTSNVDNSLDIANASRQMKQSEFRTCQNHGVRNIEEIIFGYDGVVLATNKKSGQAWQISSVDIYKALTAKQFEGNKLVNNKYNSWHDINPNLPNWPIESYIPGEKHGTREVFEEKLLYKGCEDSGAVAAMKKAGYSEKQIRNACIAVRKDGRVIAIDGDYSETLARLTSNAEAIGFFGLAYYENNADKLNVATIDGVMPSDETVSNGKYPVSRPLYFYVKKDHLRFRPGLREYVKYFLSEAMVGEDGQVVDFGLVAAPKEMREKQRKDFSEGVLMQKGAS